MAPAEQASAKIAPNRRRLPPNRPVKQEAESVWCRLARISRRTRSDRSPFRSNADDLFACSLQALRSHRDQSGTLRRSPMSVPKSRTIIKLQPTARAYRIIPLCTRGRSICLQQTEPIASQAVSYYCFIPRPPAPCAPPAPYGPGCDLRRATSRFDVLAFGCAERDQRQPLALECEQTAVPEHAVTTSRPTCVHTVEACA